MSAKPHVLRNNASRATIEKLSTLKPHAFSVQNREWGLTYQKCRFCERAVWEIDTLYNGVIGLWKYGVRHYCCEDCRQHFSRFFNLFKRPKATA